MFMDNGRIAGPRPSKRHALPRLESTRANIALKVASKAESASHWPVIVFGPLSAEPLATAEGVITNVSPDPRQR